MVSINSFTCLLVNSSTNQTTCLHMDICAYHNARRASAYKWFFYVFFYNNNPYYPWSTKRNSVEISVIRGKRKNRPVHTHEAVI